MQSDLLQQLKDLHLPIPPGWWPPAPGWWLLLLIAVATLVLGVLALLRRRARQRPYRVARAELERIGVGFDAGRLNTHDLAHALSGLLKRASIAREGRTRIARLEGDAWLEYLDGVAGEAAFTTGAGALLGARRFDPAASGDAPHLIAIVDRLLARMERGR